MSQQISIDINTIIRDLIDLGINDNKKILKYIKERFGVSYEQIAVYLVPKIISYKKLATSDSSGTYYLSLYKRYNEILTLSMELA